jgi:hypothetical protein
LSSASAICRTGLPAGLSTIACTSGRRPRRRLPRSATPGSIKAISREVAACCR